MHIEAVLAASYWGYGAHATTIYIEAAPAESQWDYSASATTMYIRAKSAAPHWNYSSDATKMTTLYSLHSCSDNATHIAATQHMRLYSDDATNMFEVDTSVTL